MAVDIYNVALLDKAPRRYKYIILHDTNCQWEKYNTYKIDKNMFQSGPMRARFKIEKHWDEMPYHFICEKIGSNYQTLVARPLQYACIKEYDDIPSFYTKYAIHVCVMGNYNILNGLPKLYQQLAYRVICPMMRLYRITKSNIFAHGELSNQHQDCPGYNFRKDMLFAYMGKFLQGTK